MAASTSRLAAGPSSTISAQTTSGRPAPRNDLVEQRARPRLEGIAEVTCPGERELMPMGQRPGMDRHHPSAAPIGLIDRPVERDIPVRRAVDADHDGVRCGARIARRSPHDHQRTRRVVCALLAHRAEQQPTKSAASARADDEQLGILGLLHEAFRDRALRHFVLDGDDRSRPHDLAYHATESLHGFLLVADAIGSRRRSGAGAGRVRRHVPHIVGRVLPDMDRFHHGVTKPPFLDRPPKGVARFLRPVHPDHNRSHSRILFSVNGVEKGPWSRSSERVVV